MGSLTRRESFWNYPSLLFHAWTVVCDLLSFSRYPYLYLTKIKGGWQRFSYYSCTYLCVRRRKTPSKIIFFTFKFPSNLVQDRCLLTSCEPWTTLGCMCMGNLSWWVTEGQLVTRPSPGGPPLSLSLSLYMQCYGRRQQSELGERKKKIWREGKHGNNNLIP